MPRDKSASSNLEHENILRPDIHDKINKLLGEQDYLNTMRTSKFMDNFENFSTKNYFNGGPQNDTSQKRSISQDRLNRNLYHVSVAFPDEPVKRLNTVETQTDLYFIADKPECYPTLAETQTISFCYSLEEKERMEQLQLLLSNNYNPWAKTVEYDPCLEFESYLRETKPRSRSSSSKGRFYSSSSQTFPNGLYLALKQNKPQNSDQSTQTIDSPSSSSSGSPLHETLKTKTITVIEKDPLNQEAERIRETFKIISKGKNDSDLAYTQTSEYTTDKSKSSVTGNVIKKNDQEKKPSYDAPKLVQSAIELTSVVNNKTTVSGIGQKYSPEKFSLHISYPSKLPVPTDSDKGTFHVNSNPTSLTSRHSNSFTKEDESILVSNKSINSSLNSLNSQDTDGYESNITHYEETYDIKDYKKSISKNKPFIVKCEESGEKQQIENKVENLNKPNHDLKPLKPLTVTIHNPIEIPSQITSAKISPNTSVATSNVVAQPRKLSAQNLVPTNVESRLKNNDLMRNEQSRPNDSSPSTPRNVPANPKSLLQVARSNDKLNASSSSLISNEDELRMQMQGFKKVVTSKTLQPSDFVNNGGNVIDIDFDSYEEPSLNKLVKNVIPNTVIREQKPQQIQNQPKPVPEKSVQIKDINNNVIDVDFDSYENSALRQLVKMNTFDMRAPQAQTKPQVTIQDKQKPIPRPEPQTVNKPINQPETIPQQEQMRQTAQQLIQKRQDMMRQQQQIIQPQKQQQYIQPNQQQQQQPQTQKSPQVYRQIPPQQINPNNIQPIQQVLQPNQQIINRAPPKSTFLSNNSSANYTGSILMKPDVKERKSSLKSVNLSKSQNNIDIDFSIYDEQSQNQQRKQTQQQQQQQQAFELNRNANIKHIPNDSNKLREAKSMDDFLNSSQSDESQDENNEYDEKLIENMRSKFLGKKVPNEEEEEPSASEIESSSEYLDSSYTGLNDSRTEQSDSTFPKIRIRSTEPLKPRLNRGSKQLTKKIETLSISGSRENLDLNDFSQESFEVDSIDPLKSNKNVPKPESKKIVKSRYEDDLEDLLIGKNTRLGKLMTDSAEKEYQKQLKRIEFRKIRVPQILDKLNTAKGKEKVKLEDELRVLMRKSKSDIRLVKEYERLIMSTKNELYQPSYKKSNLKSKRLSIHKKKRMVNQNSDSDGETDDSAQNLVSSEVDTSGYNTLTTNSRTSSIDTLKTNKEESERQRVRFNSLSGASQTSINGVPFESGYSSQEETLSMNDKRLVALKVPRKIIPNSSNLYENERDRDVERIFNKVNKSKLSNKEYRNILAKSSCKKLDSLAENFEDLANMANTIDNNMLRHEQHSKLEELSTEFVDINEAGLLEVAAGADFDPERRDRNNRFNRNQRNNFNSQRPNLNPYANFSGSSGAPSRSSNPYVNISGISNFSGRGTPSGRIQPPQVQPPPPPNQTYVNQAANPNIQANIQNIDPGIPADILNNDFTNFQVYSGSSNLPVDANPNVLPVEENRPTLPISQILYVEEATLNNLDTNNYQILDDRESDEAILLEISTGREYVILPTGWRDSDIYPYFAEEDLAGADVDVYRDPQSGRNYIKDEENSRIYYLVPNSAIINLGRTSERKDIQGMERNNKVPGVEKQLESSQQPIPPADQSRSPSSLQSQQEAIPKPSDSQVRSGANEYEMLVDSNGVIQMKYEGQDQQTDLEVNYVEEFELANVNLSNFLMEEDPESEEVYLVDPANPKRRWVILPKNWSSSEESPYLTEEDVEKVKIEVYFDPVSKRKFVVNDQTGKRYYIVPKFRNAFDFSSLSPKPVSNNSNTKDGNQSKQNDGSKLPLKGVLKDSNTKKETNQPVVKIGQEVIENFDSEPSNKNLRRIAARSPERNKSLGQPINQTPRNLANQGKIIIKQPGKPGHLIRVPNNMPDANYPRQPAGKATASGGKQGGKADKPINPKEQQLLSKIKQDTARRYFQSQKLPNMGKLWLHQLLLNQVNREKHNNAVRNYYRALQGSAAHLDTSDSNGRHWKSLTDLNDPTLNDKSELDRNRLAEIQIYGYDRFDKKKKNRKDIDYDPFDEFQNRKRAELGALADPKSTTTFGGEESPFMRSLLSEHFTRYHMYEPRTFDRNHRALVPRTHMRLRQQFLCTPTYLKNSWNDVLSKSSMLRPRIILINDDEYILTKNKKCNVYVQYIYENEGVIGTDRAYQLMLPDRGPTNPTRPLRVTLEKLNQSIKSKQKHMIPQPEIALREAPVYVYHSDGSAFYENIAQYLAGNHPKLSPKTARHILQFADSREFEEYLASKITRDEAKRLAESSGGNLIDVTKVRKDILKILNPTLEPEKPTYLHFDCEHDNLRPVDDPLNQVSADLQETTEYEIGGARIKSTFIGFRDSGEVEQVNYTDLPQKIQNVIINSGTTKQDSANQSQNNSVNINPNYDNIENININVKN